MLDQNSWQHAQLAEELLQGAMELRTMQVISQLKPKFGVDGNQFYFLLGDDPQSGIAGFGDTAALAMNDFVNNFWNCKLPHPQTSK